MRRSSFGLALGAAAALSLAGCLVDSQCQADYDCASGERCNRGNLFVTRAGSPVTQGQCYRECRSDPDCAGAANAGKQCVQGRCEFRFDERVLAPSFCLPVVNPQSGQQGKDFCLTAQQGKVVALYFAWLT